MVNCTARLHKQCFLLLMTLVLLLATIVSRHIPHFLVAEEAVYTMANKEPERQWSSHSYINASGYWVHRVQNFCGRFKYEMRNYTNNEYVKFGLPGYVWMSSPHHKLFYCAAPKCSSTTWKTYIIDDLRLEHTIDIHLVATKLGLSRKARSTRMENNYLHLLDSYRPLNRLMIVRNPWARLVSAYEDKIMDSGWSLQHMCLAGKKFPIITTPTFEMFMKCLVESDRDMMWNSHVHPFSSLCGLCHMDYNIIVKLEDTDVAEPYISYKLHFTVEPKYKPAAKGKFSKGYSDYYVNIDEETIEALADIYKHDIYIFEYPPSPFD